jgi:aldehyde dehydrogenase (NAD+)
VSPAAATASPVRVPLRCPDRLFIGGGWVESSSDVSFGVVEAATEEPYFRVAGASKVDMSRAVGAAREAFDSGPWPRMSHLERAECLRAMAAQLTRRLEDFGQVWSRESGVVHAVGAPMLVGVPQTFEFYAGLAAEFPFEERRATAPSPVPGGDFGLLVREPVGVVGAIVAWNVSAMLITAKVAPALLAGCTVVVKASPEAPGEAYLMAEAAEAAGLPAGVFNVVVADRDVSELLVRDSRVDKIAFTGSTAAGRRIGSICGERIARCTLELGGKSAAVILDDADIGMAAAMLAGAGTFLSGQACLALTRIVVTRSRHDQMVEALAAAYGAARVGDPFDPAVQMGPLAVSRQRDRVEGYIAKGLEQGARLVTGGGRPRGLDRGWFIEPTVFANVDNSSVIAQEEIFGPVLSVIPAEDERDAVRIANDSIYGLNASVFTADLDRAREVAGQLRSGTVGHNALRSDPSIAFGGFKQSGIGREGGTEGLLNYLETKVVLLDGQPPSYQQ